jgi:adenine-specific DNA-methyltransferase
MDFVKLTYAVRLAVGARVAEVRTVSDDNQRSLERRLIRLAYDLGAATKGGPLSSAETQLLAEARTLPFSAEEDLEKYRLGILSGDDPLGTELCRVRPAIARRSQGAFYTPPELAEPMVDWILQRSPDRIIDAGCGSGRFAAAAVRHSRDLPVIAIDLDPTATLLARANLAVIGATAATVLQADYTVLALSDINGRTGFVGNPPYVRHHDLSPAAKAWAVDAARRLGVGLSTLAGLHIYFYLATALRAKRGDVGCYVTSAEWLDVNYGSTLRHLLLNGLGGQSIHLIDHNAIPFADVMTTAVITCFEVGSTPTNLRLRLVSRPSDLQDLSGGREIDRETLSTSKRWTKPIFARANLPAANTIPLGTIARVHRGLVTGANHFFVLTRARATELGLLPWCRPAITTAQEILDADGLVRNSLERRLLLDVPRDVDRSAFPKLDAYLCEGEAAHGAELPISKRYIPSHRMPWWFLGRWTPPPIVASYMARQPPRFALNPDGMPILNIGHGIYPKGYSDLNELVKTLNELRESFRGSGRTYHGGLEKFEPREMEMLPIPNLAGLGGINSVKRLNREVGDATSAWREAFGKGAITGAMLSGVFKLASLKSAQAGGTTIFWEHDLDSFGQFIQSV